MFRTALKNQFKTNLTVNFLCSCKEEICMKNVHMLPHVAASVSCPSQTVSLAGPHNDIDISRSLFWPRRLGICFQAYCTGLSANGCCSPA